MNTTLTVAPVQWAEFEDIDAVEPLNPEDYACLVEIREVLQRHGHERRYGVALLHKHFDLEADEILLESSGPESRTLVTRPVRAEGAGNPVGTIFQLLDGDPESMAYCSAYCNIGGDGVHRPAHWG